MLSKDKRITSDDFKKRFEEATIVFTPHFSIKHIPSPDKPHIAVVISKKSAKTAVLRNQIRRKVYDRLATFFSDLKPVYLVVTPNKSAQKLTNATLTQELHSALAKAGVLK